MAVAFDAKVTSTTDTGSVLTVSNTTLTVGTGSNRALIAVLSINNATTPSGVGIKWDPAGTNQTLTQITGAVTTLSNTTFTYLFGLLNPTSGNKTLTATWSSAAGESHLAAASFTGVDQTSVAVAFPHGTAKSATTATSGTLSITSATNNMVLAAYSQAVASFASVSGTTLSLDGTATGFFSTASLYTAGTATVNTTSAWGGTSTTYGAVGTDMLAAVTAGVSLGIPQSDLFQPGKRMGPTRGLRPTQAFPPAITVPSAQEELNWTIYRPRSRGWGH